MLTDAEIAVQRALYKLWYEHYTQPMTQKKRNQLAADFAEQWLDPSRIKVDKPFIKHPMTIKKIKQRTCTVGEVLSDFILRVDQNAEKSADYPILNRDAEVRRVRVRRERERSIVFESEYDKGMAEIAESNTPGSPFRMPPFSVYERDLTIDNSVEAELFVETSASVEDFRHQLKKVKWNPRKFARKYEAKGYLYNDTLRRIRRLDISRVRECRECGQAFYAHDLRRYVCDLQHGRTEKGERSTLSACELSADRRRSEIDRNNSDKSA